MRDGRWRQAQLGAWRQEAEANDAWNRAVRRAGGDLAGLAPHIVPVDLPGRGRYYRLRVSADAGAAKLCASLAAKGLDCLADAGLDVQRQRHAELSLFAAAKAA